MGCKAHNNRKHHPQVEEVKTHNNTAAPPDRSFSDITEENDSELESTQANPPRSHSKQSDVSSVSRVVSIDQHVYDHEFPSIPTMRTSAGGAADTLSPAKTKTARMTNLELLREVYDLTDGGADDEGKGDKALEGEAASDELSDPNVEEYVVY